MGLDITAYSNLTLVPDAELDEDGCPLDDSLVRLRPDWTPQGADVEGGTYAYSGSFRFRAGSYSGYNAWRDWLAKLAGHTSAESVWRDPKPGPFVELINFSDCEGIIGPAACAKLAEDFAAYAATIDQGTDDYSQYSRVYNAFAKAFELGAQRGCVEFH